MRWYLLCIGRYNGNQDIVKYGISILAVDAFLLVRVPVVITIGIVKVLSHIIIDVIAERMVSIFFIYRKFSY